ncbi:type 1 glutamine amidotransferase [Fructilactobacillus fructivorans]|uniref:Lipid II isoglutaminyl synthase (glutamine-hydrolyzing) subunit GatD n=1 Tax=Fructilactobacillus fructivorans TaxID=1614 RepID=A0A0C1PLI6_9LACO|nr:DJ-1/PfpI family protein [Fructilactobacillus fructivorans]KID41607.1 putative amidotransferase similar to cobyric acid synthase [Fructilactobacillus fructivorans]KRK57808.1 glutamine amidotransferase [Fructilactobacillus fructivorans]KRN12651.1 glutamine amidotransferase [Fructilactobacillus fructivorans]KRN40686.1 glutamine amidotransferase [Fructilactobacillus fructivorans]KRN43225.1 glutamine amidotransferase [Fructilactobacillus fructivorans]
MTKTIRVAHLYGDLMNTYGDIGNILSLRYYAKQIGVEVTSNVVSLEEDFNADDYDFMVFGGGQDFEQTIVSKDIQTKKDEIKRFIEQGKPVIAICGGFQLLGNYYVAANGKKLPGIGALDHYTDAMKDNRFIGNIEIQNEQTKEKYHGFENHAGVTYLGPSERALGKVIKGHGNNGKDGTEGAIYKNTVCTYFHGPILARNGNLAKRMMFHALEKKYPETDFTSEKPKVKVDSF